MKCRICGKDFRPSGVGSPSKYCSAACRQKAYRRRKSGKTPAGKKPAAVKTAAKKSPAKKTATKRKKPEKAEAVLDKGGFDLMMTPGMAEALPFVAKHLRDAIKDPDTPANALANLSKEYLAVTEQIDSSKTPDLLSSLDGADSADETVDVGSI